MNKIIAWFSTRKKARQLQVARLERAAARERLRKAVERHDDRAVGQARMWLQQATHQVIALELGR